MIKNAISLIWCLNCRLLCRTSVEAWDRHTTPWALACQEWTCKEDQFRHSLPLRGLNCYQQDFSVFVSRGELFLTCYVCPVCRSAGAQEEDHRGPTPTITTMWVPLVCIAPCSVDVSYLSTRYSRCFNWKPSQVNLEEVVNRLILQPGVLIFLTKWCLQPIY